MSRLVQAPARLFEQLLLPATAPRTCPPMRSFVAASLFDLPAEPIRLRRPEPRLRREEDSERWDGLS
jgi:hypothetical protein